MNELVLVAVLTLSFVGFIHFTRRSALPLPPSPPQSFISGNYHDMPKQQSYATYARWAKIYGPIFHIRVFNQYIILLNNAKTALDLLESRSNIYSDRPRSVFLEKVLKRHHGVFRLPFDHPRFRTYRRMMHSGLSPRAVQGYQPLQIQEVNILLRGLADNPKDFIPHLRRNAGSLILKVTYGYEVSSDNDDFIQLVERAFAIQASRFQRPMAVEFFPFLRFFPSWFPFTDFWQLAAELETARTELVPFQWAKNLIESGSYTDSFVSRFLRPQDGSVPGEEDQDIVKWVAAALYVGGADTTVSAMTSFFYLMETNPEVQKRAQADIDKVTGGSRLPTPDDEEKLPYIVALIKEVISIADSYHAGLQHRVMDDDVYEGYHIPKGATVVANIWFVTHIPCHSVLPIDLASPRAITHDPEVYPNPDEFKPDRHLGDNTQLDPFKLVFGFGKRVCPGENLARRSLFLAIANILAVFNLEKEVNEKGDIIEPPMEFHGGTTSVSYRHVNLHHGLEHTEPIYALDAQLFGWVANNTRAWSSTHSSKPFYDDLPLPAGWQSNAYTPLNKEPNHAQLNSWAKGAIAWSQTNLKAALTKAGRTYVHSKWRTGNPRLYQSQNQVPAGTPQYRPNLAAFEDINLEAAEDEKVELVEE
ncbi:hypothetical protein VNI00_014683 [Paramarasmius palmivorus]|uniref:Cytochrome P450 n=1 Tax=Paramarasmius palmivorus TaxID=297713 RepID=A0AAW0BSN7_9AGAR